MAKIIDTVKQLEAMVDARGLLHILTGLEIMCDEKAMHIRTNWQDNETAKVWSNVSRRLGNLARDIEKLGI